VLLRIAALVPAIVADRGPRDQPRPRSEACGTPIVPSGWISLRFCAVVPYARQAASFPRATVPRLPQSSTDRALDRHSLPRYVRSRGTILKIIALFALVGAGVYLRGSPWSSWNRFQELSLGVAVAVYVAAVVRGRLRDAFMVVASVGLGLTVAEAYALVVSAPAIEINAPGYSVLRSIVGWGPGQPGVYRARKLDGRSGSVIYDVGYTIDADRNRQVISAPMGPTVAFFGDSMTFGQGVPDADTLPQAFADATGYRWHVLNLAFPGYGPQQFLRALETDVFRDLLTEPRLFVLLTAPWHAERSSCLSDFGADGPRYVLVDGMPRYEGTCRGNWPVRLRPLWTRTAMYSMFFEPVFGGARSVDIDLFVSILVRAGQLARGKYGVPTLILYWPDEAYTRRAGVTEAQIMGRLREGGLVVIDARLDPKDFPGQELEIPGDGHPTGVANRARALLVRDALAGMTR